MHSSLSLSTPTRLRRSKRLAQTCTYEDDGTASLNSAQRAVSLPASKTVFLLRDDSPLENLLSCSDFVTFTESHGRNVEPRVLISRNAKALWHEGPEFAFVVRSIVRFLDIKYIAPSPTLSYPVVLKLSSFVKNQLGKAIPAGVNVVQYLGEYFKLDEWEKLGRGPYSWTFQHLYGDQERVLNALDYRNEAAYVNFACDSNLGVAVTCRGQNKTLPVVLFRSLRAIKAGEELTIPYYPGDSIQPNFATTPIVQCLCASPVCSRTIFYTGQ